MNPNVEKFVSSVRKKYKERLINRETQWPYRQSSSLVRLQLVHREKAEGTSTSIQREKEDKRSPLAYCNLLKGDSGKAEPATCRKVLVEGDAGIGKTTFTIILSEEWARDELFTDFELVLLLPLRHEKIALAGSLSELLGLLHTNPSVCESVSIYLREEEAEKVLVIADGWDELSECKREKGSFLYNFLFEEFPFMSVVVTSRPFASASLHSLPCIDRFVDIKGFNNDDIEEYVLSEFGSDQEKAERLLEQLKSNPLIESVCSIPLNCAIVCHLWDVLKEALPSTMTQLYTRIILHFVCWNLRKLPAYGPKFSMDSFIDLPEGLQKSWWRLCKFAFKALEKDQIVFTKRELLKHFPEGIEQLLCFGLLQSVETVLDVTCVVSFNFLHLTFMEYLAALHLSRKRSCRWLEVLNNYRFIMVLRFFFGVCFSSLSRSNISEVKRVFQNVLRENNTLHICHCALEAQYESGNEMTDKTVSYLFDGASAAFRSLAVLDLRDNRIEGECINYITAALTKSSSSGCRLSRLFLSANPLRVSGLQALCKAIHVSGGVLSELKLLYLSGSLTSDADTNAQWLTEFGDNLSARYPHLMDLDISQNNLGVPGAKALAKVVSKLQHRSMKDDGSIIMPFPLSDFDLNQTNLGDEGLCAFIDSLKGVCVCHFEKLQLKHNGIHAKGVLCLADAICSQKVVIKGDLCLSDNFLGLEGTLAVGKILSCNHCQLSHLDLSGCMLTTARGGLANMDPLGVRDGLVHLS